MATFDDYVVELQKGIRKLTQGFVDDLQTSAFSDANAFVRDLASLHELTRAGVALTNLDRFRADLICLLINTATKVYL